MNHILVPQAFFYCRFPYVVIVAVLCSSVPYSHCKLLQASDVIGQVRRCLEIAGHVGSRPGAR